MKLNIFPPVALLAVMIVMIAIDFVTGVAKAYLNGDARTSSGFRKTVIKFLQYFGSLSVSIVFSFAANYSDKPDIVSIAGKISSGLVWFIIYIEVTSICENLVAVDDKSAFANYIVKPIHKLLTFQIRNNPAVKAAGNIEDPTQDSFTK